MVTIGGKKKLAYCSTIVYNLNRNSGVSLRSALGEVGCVRPPLSILQILYVSCFRYPQTFNSGGWSKPGNTKRLLRGRNHVSVTFDAYMVSAPFHLSIATEGAFADYN